VFKKKQQFDSLTMIISRYTNDNAVLKKNNVRYRTNDTRAFDTKVPLEKNSSKTVKKQSPCSHVPVGDAVEKSGIVSCTRKPLTIMREGLITTNKRA